MSQRQPLPERRPQVSVEAAFRRDPLDNPTPFTVSIGLYPDGRPGEVFFDPRQSGLTPLLRDAAVLASLALQHGATLADLAGAVTRGEDGSRPLSIIGAALDAAATEAATLAWKEQG
jgi:hypothetical protein